VNLINHHKDELIKHIEDEIERLAISKEEAIKGVNNRWKGLEIYNKTINKSKAELLGDK